MRERNHCILLIEDRLDDADLVIEALRTNRIANEIVHAKDGEEARDYVFGLGAHEGRDVCAPPQLILLDLKLPKIDGLDVLRRIRADERTRMTPVVVLTSSAEEEDVVRSYGLGANSFVRKPVAYDEFLEAIRTLAVYWLLVNEPPPEDAKAAA